MSVSLSIKNVPEAVVEKLRRRAERNHRSLQGELISIISDPWLLDTMGDRSGSDIDMVIAEIATLGLRTPGDSTAMIREDRDNDHGRG